MSTDEARGDQPKNGIGNPLTMKEMTVLLVKHYGLREGRFELLVEFQIGTGAVGQAPDNICPGAIIGVAKMGLARTDSVSPLTVDAADVNPAIVRPKRAR